MENDQPSGNGKQPKKRPGPPNRMNNLIYRDWMKFQKSFFRHQSSQRLVEECVYFFTKALWSQGQPSRSLLIGFPDFDRREIPAPRSVESEPAQSLGDLVATLQQAGTKEQEYDFVLIDLRDIILDEASLADYLLNYAEIIMSLLRQMLAPMRYCGFVAGVGGEGGTGFPLAWSIALSCRDHLRLRDEKIGLIEASNNVYYCLFMQANDDGRPVSLFTPDRVKTAAVEKKIPAWSIPRPRPRKKNEVLHPAKYPEELVQGFIDLFTKPGDNVLDPMMGTGSTLIAALRANRHGYGVDLNPSFVEITEQRLVNERNSALFQEFSTSSQSCVIVGDSCRLDEISALDGVNFQYAVTSPPYWSMLSNPGSENQAKRRQRALPLIYSNDERDLGNVADYDRFVELLEKVYNEVAGKLVPGGYLTVVVKNVKREHIVYTLAWDLVARLCGSSGRYEYAGTTLWCQDDVGLKPFAVGIHWVSNTLHHYCLHFRKREQ
jgi:DNA modification methylase